MEMLTVVTLSAIRAVSKGASPAGRGRGQSALHPEYRDREAVNEGKRDYTTLIVVVKFQSVIYCAWKKGGIRQLIFGVSDVMKLT